MANRKVKDHLKKESISVTLTNHVHVKFKEICEQKDLYWSLEVEKFMIKFNEKHGTK